MQTQQAPSATQAADAAADRALTTGEWRYLDQLAADFATQQDEDDERECRAERVAMLRGEL